MKLKAPDSIESLYDQESIQFPLADIPQIRADLIEAAIRRIFDALMKSLVSIQTKELIAARNRVYIPFGLFTMSYDKFFERRRNDIVYLGLMEFICSRTLEKAKHCVVLDDLQQMVGKMARGYHTGQMGPIFDELEKAKKLLKVHLDIYKDYGENLEELAELTEKLRLFSKQQRVVEMMLETSIQKKGNRLREKKLIIDKMKVRYCSKYFDSEASQIILRDELAIQQVEYERDNYNFLTNREEHVFESTRMKVAGDTNLIKSKIKEWSDAYDNDMDRLLGDMAYKTNSILVWQHQIEDLKERMKFYDEDIVRLFEWDANRKAEKLERERQEALKLILKQRKHHKKRQNGKKDEKNKIRKEEPKMEKHKQEKHKKAKKKK